MQRFLCFAKATKGSDSAENHRRHTAWGGCDGCGGASSALPGARHVPDATAWVRDLPLDVLADILQLITRRAHLASIAVSHADGAMLRPSILGPRCLDPQQLAGVHPWLRRAVQCDVGACDSLPALWLFIPVRRWNNCSADSCSCCVRRLCYVLGYVYWQ